MTALPSALLLPTDPALAALAALLNPGLLILGGILVGVPILIHLLSRRRIQRVPWAAMQWLMAAVKRHQRRLRIENWLILLLRALAVLLLGLALARPILENANLAGLLAGKRSVYLVVDTSYSMGARREGRAVVDVAQAEADAVLSGLGSEDAVAVVVTNDPRTNQSDGRSPYPLVPRSVGYDGATRAKEAVATLRPRDAGADWVQTLEAVREQTAAEDVNRVIVLVTDLQSRDWREERVLQALEDLVLSPAAVRIVDVGATERRNLTVAEVRNIMRRDVFVGRPAQLDIAVENQGEQPIVGAHLHVYRDQNATPLYTQRVPDVDAANPTTGAPGSVRVPIDLPGHSFPEGGSQVLEVAVEPPHEDPGSDALGLDSRRSLALNVRERIRVLAWTQASRGAPIGAETYLRGIFEPWESSVDRPAQGTLQSSLYELETVDTETALGDALARSGPTAPDLLVLANVAPRGDGVDAIRSFVRAGGSLLVFVGDGTPDPAALNDAFHADADQRLLPLPYGMPDARDRARDEPFAIDLESDTGHALAGPFTGEDAMGWIGEAPPRIWGRMPFREETTDAPAPGEEGPGDDGTREAAAAVVLRFTDGRPAVVEGSLGLGRTLWVATSVDDGWFERALPFFLPVFLDEAAVYLTRPDEARRNLTVGRRIVVTWLPPDAANVRFTAPGGTESTPTRYEGQGEGDRPVFIQDRVGRAGTWRLMYEREGAPGELERVTEMFAVNPDPGEGRLHRAPDGAILGAMPQGPEIDVQILRTWSEVKEEGNQARQGEVSFAVVWIALGLLVLESLLAWAFGRRRGASAPAPTGEE